MSSRFSPREYRAFVRNRICWGAGALVLAVICMGAAVHYLRAMRFIPAIATGWLGAAGLFLVVAMVSSLLGSRR